MRPLESRDLSDFDDSLIRETSLLTLAVNNRFRIQGFEALNSPLGEPTYQEDQVWADEAGDVDADGSTSKITNRSIPKRLHIGRFIPIVRREGPNGILFASKSIFRENQPVF